LSPWVQRQNIVAPEWVGSSDERARPPAFNGAGTVSSTVQSSLSSTVRDHCTHSPSGMVVWTISGIRSMVVMQCQARASAFQTPSPSPSPSPSPWPVALPSRSVDADIVTVLHVRRGNGLQFAAAVRAVFQVDLEHTFEQSRQADARRPAVRVMRLIFLRLHACGTLASLPCRRQQRERPLRGDHFRAVKCR
jgi:hypothetical protein